MSRDFLSLSRPPLPPFILSIPNEVLHHVLSLLPVPNSEEPLVQYNSDGKAYRAPQMLILRSVCRKFRAIVAELDFWYDSRFNFALLITPRVYGSPADYVGGFLKILFSDSNLVNSLGRRKTDWMFEGLAELRAVMEGVPLFIQNARAISLEIWDDNDNRVGGGPSRLHTTITNLSACAHVTTLSISAVGSVNLDAIAASFPSLEILNCLDFNHYSGSLRELNCLRKLAIYNWTTGTSTTLLRLPFNSAETLTELRLEFGIFSNPVFDTTPLNAFINLKSLGIGPFCDSICDFIINAKIHLDVFKTSFNQKPVSLDKFAKMGRANCLRDLKKLELYSYYDVNHNVETQWGRGDYSERYWSQVFDAFTFNHISVEEVQLGVPLHVQYCAYLARMVNLKLLVWHGNGCDEFGYCLNRDRKAMLEEVLETAFTNFMKKPRIVVHLVVIQ